MTAEKDLARVRNPVLLLSAAGWALLLADPHGMPVHCAVPMAAGSWRMLLAMNPLAARMAGWALMLVAMMAPALIVPLTYLRLNSFRRRRARSMGLFAAGYAGVWMIAGVVLLALEMGARAMAPESYGPALAVAATALVWQCSPMKQSCLNHCHAHGSLAAFGGAADRDALGFGLSHGVWCAGSCWAWMLLPMLLPRGHVMGMAGVTVLILGERLERPARPEWRWRGVGRLMRIVRRACGAAIAREASGPNSHGTNSGEAAEGGPAFLRREENRIVRDCAAKP